MVPSNRHLAADRLRRRLADERGLTIMEIMVVIAILGILGTVVAINVLGAVDDAKADTTRQSIATVKQALTMFKLRYNRYPNTSEGLDALLNPPVGNRGEQYEPFLDKEPVDGWGNAFQYFSPGQGCQADFEVRSLGKDGAEGGSGTSADITSCTI
jgi:general secretion pathway protein G